ncbi:hypothetical protein NDU88_001627 [Pleurodeles waltl]|uniref:Uncharacterized protein n=1 Tax=Pleurodeles waltl TaxID=8319 RepID=A0AAV7U8M0_PLEWA|nr:hypothetical protein NDU88_001627 [Pleurodeles waltl]
MGPHLQSLSHCDWRHRNLSAPSPLILLSRVRQLTTRIRGSGLRAGDYLNYMPSPSASSLTTPGIKETALQRAHCTLLLQYFAVLSPGMGSKLCCPRRDCISKRPSPLPQLCQSSSPTLELASYPAKRRSFLSGFIDLEAPHSQLLLASFITSGPRSPFCKPRQRPARPEKQLCSPPERPLAPRYIHRRALSVMWCPGATCSNPAASMKQDGHWAGASSKLTRPPSLASKPCPVLYLLRYLLIFSVANRKC